MDALVSRRRSRAYEGLWMKEPQEFLFDPLARARRCLQTISGAAGRQRNSRMTSSLGRTSPTIL